MKSVRLVALFLLFCPLLELTRGSSVIHQQTLTKANGDETTHIWSSGGDEDLLAQVHRLQGVDRTAVEELLSAKKPVVREHLDDRGQKLTSSYSLSPDGGIMCESIAERATSSSRHGAKEEMPVERFAPEGVPMARLGQRLHWPAMFGEASGEPDRDAVGDEEAGRGRMPPRRKYMSTNRDTAPFGTPYWPTATDFFKNPDLNIVRDPEPNRVRVTQSWRTEPQQFFSRSSFTGTPFPTDDWPRFEDLFRGGEGRETTGESPKLPESNAQPNLETEKVDDNDGKLVTTWTTKTIKYPTVISRLPPPPSASPKPHVGEAASTALSSDLESLMKKDGITLDELKNSNGEPIVRTRTEPDGRTVQTTYRVRPMPSTNDLTEPERQNALPETAAHEGYNNVDAYLGKMDLTARDILSQKGQTVTKTIVDEDGRILTATFMLSEVKHQSPNNGGAPKAGLPGV